MDTRRGGHDWRISASLVVRQFFFIRGSPRGATRQNDRSAEPALQQAGAASRLKNSSPKRGTGYDPDDTFW